MRVGISLSTFHDDPARVLQLAKEAEGAGIDGVFLFDHLWHINAKGKPALHGPTLMGAVAAVTDQIRIGSLVARVGIQHTAVLVAMLTTLDHMAPGRVIAGLGVGDGMNRDENEAFGIPFTPRPQRMEELRQTAEQLRGEGIEVWFGGSTASMWNAAAVDADAVNLWNTPVAMTREAVRQAAPATVTWAGIAREVVADPGIGAHLEAQAEAGATWVIYSAGSGDTTLVPRLADARQKVGL